MIKFESEDIDLGKVKNAALIPYQFKGVNETDHTVYLTVQPTCGCSVMEKDVEVAPKSNFVLSGNLTKRPAAKKYRKKVAVFAKKDKEATAVDKSFALYFNVEVFE